jgi:hypothetical protein
MKVRWLDRRLGPPGPYLALCLSQAEYREAVQHLKSPEIPRWVGRGANATTHTFTHEENGIVCIVCIEGHENHSPIEVAGMLVHEAVHVWQQWCDEIGETRPGTEQEAYAIQAISQELMAEFTRRIK